MVFYRMVFYRILENWGQEKHKCLLKLSKYTQREFLFEYNM